MPIPKPPEPYRTWLGRLLRSEEEADKERERIRRRRALEARDWNAYFGGKDERDLRHVRHPEAPLPAGEDARRNGHPEAVPGLPQKAQRQVSPPAAEKLYDWLIGHGFRVYLKDGKLYVGPGPLSKTLRGAVNQHLKGLRLLLTKDEG